MHRLNTTGPGQYGSAPPTSSSSPSAAGIIVTPELLVANTPSHSFRKGENIENFLQNITHLSLNNKRIRRLDCFEYCPNLQVLYLYENRLEGLEGLERSSRLTRLYAQHNNIPAITTLERMTKLEKLNLSDNRIVVLEGLHNCVNLEELEMANQRLPLGQPLLFSEDTLVTLANCLSVLNLAGNQIEDPAPLAMLDRLQSLNLSNNNISRLENVAAMLNGLESLQILDLRQNPLCKLPKYRDKMILMTSSTLTTLDDKAITTKERSFLHALEAKKRQGRSAAGGPPSLPPSYPSSAASASSSSSSHLSSGAPRPPIRSRSLSNPDSYQPSWTGAGGPSGGGGAPGKPPRQLSGNSRNASPRGFDLSTPVEGDLALSGLVLMGSHAPENRNNTPRR